MWTNPKRLSELSRGDSVAVHRGDGISLGEVARVTKTKMVLEDGTEWLIRNGERYGYGRDRWRVGSWIEPWCEPEHRGQMAEYRREVARLKACRRLEDFRYRGLPDEALAKLLAILDHYAPRPEKAAGP